jgi:hypothetical protein
LRSPGPRAWQPVPDWLPSAPMAAAAAVAEAGAGRRVHRSPGDSVARRRHVGTGVSPGSVAASAGTGCDEQPHGHTVYVASHLGAAQPLKGATARTKPVTSRTRRPAARSRRRWLSRQPCRARRPSRRHAHKWRQHASCHLTTVNPVSNSATVDADSGPNAHAHSGTDAHPDANAHSHSNTNSDVHTDTDAEFDADPDTGPERAVPALTRHQRPPPLNQTVRITATAAPRRTRPPLRPATPPTADRTSPSAAPGSGRSR